MKDVNLGEIKGFSKSELNFLGKPLLSLVVVVVIAFVTISFILNNLTSLNQKIASNDKVAKTLQQKVSTLQTVSTLIPEDNLSLNIVLPSKGAVLYAISQIKNQASQSNLLLSSLKTGNESEETGNVRKISVSFEAEGTETDLFNFLNSFSTMLPLMNVAKVDINKSGEIIRANVTINVYSADMPKKIPTVTENIKGFSSEETQLLRELMTYKMPYFSMSEENTLPLENTTRDPFN